jgi:hypothetical protein
MATSNQSNPMCNVTTNVPGILTFCNRWKQLETARVFNLHYADYEFRDSASPTMWRAQIRCLVRSDSSSARPTVEFAYSPLFCPALVSPSSSFYIGVFCNAAHGSHIGHGSPHVNLVPERHSLLLTTPDKETRARASHHVLEPSPKLLHMKLTLSYLGKNLDA